MTAVLGIIAVFLLTFGTAYFVAQEFAYVSADRIELSRQAAAGDKRAASAVRVMKRLSFMLSAAQVGITVTALLVGFLAQPAFSQVLRPVLDWIGLPGSAVTGVSIAAAFILATVIQMVLGELFPKNLALAKAEAMAKALAASTHVYLAISGPVIRMFDSSANRLLRWVGIQPVEELHHGATLEELGHIIDEAEAQGSLSPQLSDVLGRALSFSEHTAGEAMVPRPDVISVSANAPAASVIDLIRAHGHTSYPVLGATTDDIVGVVGVRELMRVPESMVTDSMAGDIARLPLLVPDSLALLPLIRRMGEHDDEFACVLDEYGGLAGIITLEDIAEELVGEIEDETDQESVPATLVDGWWLLDAGLRVDEATTYTGIELPESEDYDTVGGLIAARLGRLAEPGDVVTIDLPGTDDEHRGVVIEVQSVDRRVPERIRMRHAVEVQQ
ncbi:hemolysin family protein [Phytoactinopolyspora limicola]|uniref:hemolysin family protein n=1 Tax=Phytoactinopolyspora limicola TaxID=2715536 RepID=UPI001407DD53|nr:hemolysin family protein [Phytoactinopolyspora limicola]